MFDNFWVVTTIFNPAHYKSRNVLYHEFIKRMNDAGVKVLTVELAFGNKPFEVTEEGNPHHLQLRTDAILWHKEKLINLGVERLPKNWEYVAWIDADLNFLNPNWVQDTVLRLQYHPVVQMFSQAIDLTAQNDVLRVHEGFAWLYHNGNLTTDKLYAKKAHPGFAWAMKRDTFNKMGGLIDFAILGSADQHMAHAFIGKMAQSLVKGYSEGYKSEMMDWQADCDRHIKGNLGYVPGAIAHYWHGNKKDRGYTTRFKLLIKHQYDPNKHLERDWQGVYRFDQTAHLLEYDIYKYFLSRNEDSIEQNTPS